MEWITKTFRNYQNAIDFCYSKNIPLDKIEKYSSPKDLYWRYVVKFLNKSKNNIKK